MYQNVVRFLTVFGLGGVDKFRCLEARYGKFSLISLTVHFIDEDWNYREVPVGARNFKGRHINEQVWNHLVTMLIECGILQATKEEYYFHPDV